MKRNREKTKENKGNSKGFNLFTPLVGTSVIIISILISITMIQNSINISQGVSKTHSASRQSIGAQSIETAVAVETLGNLERRTKEVIAGELSGVGNYITITCDNGKSCTNKNKETFENWSILKDNILPRAHIGIEDRIDIATDYKVVPGQSCPYGNVINLEECIAEVIEKTGADIIKTSYSEKRLEVTLNPEPFKPYSDAFEVELEREDDETRITSDVTPPRVTYTTPEMEEYLKNMADAFDHFKANQDQEYEQICPEMISILGIAEDFELYLTKGPGESIRMQVEWKDIGENTGLNLEYQSTEFAEIGEEPHRCQTI